MNHIICYLWTISFSKRNCLRSIQMIITSDYTIENIIDIIDLKIKSTFFLHSFSNRNFIQYSIDYEINSRLDRRNFVL
jgi:hypothetical protein